MAYADLVRRWPHDVEVLTLAAQHRMTLARYREAIDLLRVARRIDPHAFHAADKLGFAYQKVNEFDKAIAAYEAARQLKPYDTDVLYDLQVLYRRTSRHQEAYDVVRAILTIDPNHSGAQRLLPYAERNRPR